MTPERVSSEQHFNMVCLFHYCMCVVVHRLTLGRPSSPILLDKTTSPVVKDAPVDIGQVSIVCKSSVCVCMRAHMCVFVYNLSSFIYIIPLILLMGVALLTKHILRYCCISHSFHVKRHFYQLYNCK